MGLWTALIKRLQAATCDLFQTTLDIIHRLRYLNK